tara:strand:- start:4254 stop:4565 length:312 start_codon:yes stop_codon:yes gene_type:complete
LVSEPTRAAESSHDAGGASITVTDAVTITVTCPNADANADANTDAVADAVTRSARAGFRDVLHLATGRAGANSGVDDYRDSRCADSFGTHDARTGTAVHAADG